jgi:hypothetical protein
MGIRLNLLCNGQIAKTDKFRENYERMWPCEDEIGRNLMDKTCQEPENESSKN